MSIENFLLRIEGGLEKKAKSLWTAMTQYADEGISALKNFFCVLVPQEVAVLKPYAVEALGEAADAVPTLIAGLVSSGGNIAVSMAEYVAAVTPVMIATAKKAEAAGVSAAGAAVSTAVHAVIADAAASQAAKAPAPENPPTG